MKKSFSDFFPVPAFLEMRPMGLAISERVIHAVEFVKVRGSLRLGRFGTRPIPPGVIKEGYVNDKSVVTEILRSLQKELSMEFVNASLPEEKSYLFKTEFPKAGVTDLRQAIELRLEDNVPISGNDAIFDYMVIPESPNADHIDVSVSASPSKVVLTYLEIIKAAGLKPLSFCVGVAATSRAVISHDDLGTFLIVNIEETSTDLSIVSRGVVQFNLTISIGGEALTTALEKHFSVDTKTALKIKEERGFVKNRENMELFLSLMNTISAVKDEVNKLFSYWQTHQDSQGAAGKKIEKIILCGRDANLAGFDEYLSTSVKVPVEVAKVWQNAFSYDTHVPNIPFLDSLDYASAIGLALPREN
ncbi:MAG: pilus assembly protein PilM [bacterium]|nr:pilus assembly protein PilM [bacterium]